MKNKSYLLFLILVLPFTFAFSKKNIKTKHIEVADTVCARVDSQLCKKYQFGILGRGGKMAHNIKEIYRSYYLNQSYDLKKTRQLVIESSQSYISEVNQNHAIRPFLDVFPFTNQQLVLEISFLNPKTSEYFAPPAIGLVVAEKGYVKYYTSPHPASPFKLVQKETFEQAQKIVNE